VSAVVARAKEFGLIIGELDPAAAKARDIRLQEELRSGKTQTIRQKFIPDLTGGLIASGAPAAGTLFPQPFIYVDGGVARLDDLIEPEFAIVTASPDLLDGLSRGAIETWRRLHGVRIVIRTKEAPVQTRPDALGFKETDRLFADWLDRNGIVAAIVRPDRAVFGGAGTADELNRLIVALAGALGQTAGASVAT